MSDTSQLPHTTPEAQGIPSTAIHAFVDAVERDVHHLHSLMLLRHGHVVAEGWWDPYTPGSPHMLFSLSKSFTATAIGLLVAEGQLSLDAPVLAFFPDEAPSASQDTLRAMRVRHLLTMTTGHTENTFGLMRQSADWARAFLAQPVAREPGTHFVYNTGATYMLSAIAQRITGTRLLVYLEPRLFEPLGIERPIWEMSPQGIDVGGSGLSATTDAIARFGQLYLQEGVWQGRRLLPAAWVAEATACQVSNGANPHSDWEQGYGYQFWRCRHGAYRGDGAFSQFCVVLPAQKAVLAMTGGTADMPRVLDLVWAHLLPAMEPAPLVENRAARDALDTRLAALRLPPPEGRESSPTAAPVSGRTVVVAPNADAIDALSFSFEDAGCTLTLRNGWGLQRIRCGAGAWSRGAASIEQATPWPVAASGAWADERTYVAQLWWYETPFGRTLTCRFEGERLAVDQQVNVGFGPTDRPHLEGRLL